MVLCIAAGILLAILLLPLLGPLVLSAILVITVIAIVLFVVFGIFAVIGVGSAAVSTVEEASEKRLTSFKVKVKASPEFNRALTAINELLTLQGLGHKPVGLWYKYVLNERLHNCYMEGAFRIENKLNRTNLEKYLNKVLDKKGKNPASLPKAKKLSQEILACHDHLCNVYSPPSKK